MRQIHRAGLAITVSFLDKTDAGRVVPDKKVIVELRREVDG